MDILNYMHKNVPRRTRLPPGNGVVLFTSMSDACALAALHHQDANARSLVLELTLDPKLITASPQESSHSCC